MKKPEEIHILLLEKDIINKLVHFSMLQSCGYVKVTIANTDLELIEQCHKSKFDIVIIDITRFKLANFQGLVDIRTMPEYKDTPIVVITPFFMPHELETLFEFGASINLLKPISKEDLIEVIRQYFPS